MIHRLKAFLVFTLFNSCIDRISIEIPETAGELVVDGHITDASGPYFVKLSQASRLDENLNFAKPVTANRVILFDKSGNSEELQEIAKGVYQTSVGGMRGVLGEEYFIRIEMKDGKIYESLPDRLNPAGEIDSLYYDVTQFQPIDGLTQYMLNVYVDAAGLPNGENLYRWRFTGTSIIETYPGNSTINIAGGDRCTPFPRPCSNNGPNSECTCCTCWVTYPLFEFIPIVSDNQLVSNNKLRRIKVASVPLHYFLFQFKYRIEVNQMSLSRTSFDFWKIIQSQKEGVGSLFQPSSGRTRTNILERNGLAIAHGIFYASAVNSKKIYITNLDIITYWKKLRIPDWACEKGRIAED